MSQSCLSNSESGTCNICSVPCSSCMHRNCALSVMDSDVVSAPSGNTSKIKEEDNSSCIGGNDNADENKAFDDFEHTSRETSSPFSSKSLDGVQHGSEYHNDDMLCTFEVKNSSNGSVKKTTRRRSFRNKVEKVIGNKDAVDDPNDATAKIANSMSFSQSEEFLGKTCGTDLQEKGSSCNFFGDEFPPSRNLEERDHSKNSKDILEKDYSQLGNSAAESPAHDDKTLLTVKAADDCVGMKDVPYLQQDNTDSEPANKSSSANDGCEKSNLSEDSSNVQLVGLQNTTTKEISSAEIMDDVFNAQEKNDSSEHTSSEEVEDVKVCDICGDVGEEEKLAICTKCNDGAEHIYCMRVMMEEVPEGEWLCEECQIEVATEKEKKKLEKSQVKVGIAKGPSFEGKMEKPVDAAKQKVSCTNDVEDENVGTKVFQKANQSSGIASKMKEDDSGTAFLAGKKLSEPGGLSTDVADSRKRMLPSRDSSFKLDVEKAKPASCQAQTPLLSNTPKNQAPPARGQLFKSVSFNNSKVPKVKQLVNEVPQKPKNLKESSLGIIRKEGPINMLTKLASFKNSNSSEPSNKTRSSILSHTEEPRVMKPPMDRNAMNNRSTSILGRPSNTPSMATTVPPKADSASQDLVKGNKMVDSNNFSIGQGLGGHNEIKKLYLAKAPGGILLSSAEGPSGILGSISQKKITQISDHSLRDDKIKDPPSLRQVASSSSRTTRCQRCNEASHSTQFCAVDKLRVSAIKPLGERNLKDGSTRKNKPSEASTSTATEQAPARSAVQSEHILKCGPNHNQVFRPKDVLPTSFSSVKKPHLLDVRISEQEMGNSSSTPSITVAMSCNKANNEDQVYATRGRTADIICIPKDLRDKTQIFSRQVCAPIDESTASTIPELQYIWQGGFEVSRTGRSPELCDGVQAHLSSSASPKVLEAANNIPSKVQLEEVPRQTTWPLQFQEKGPTDNNIGLFFFARDIQSYENHYSKLVENMLKNDLVLRGNVEAVELLIFPSNLLPRNSQRWNKFYFLWGVFRVSREDCMKDPPDVPRSECEFDFKKDQTVSILSSVYSPSMDTNDFPEQDSLIHEEPGDRSTNNISNKAEEPIDVGHANTTQTNSNLVDMPSHVLGDARKRNVEMTHWADEANDAKEHKKMKIDNGGPVNSISSEDIRDGRLLSKVHPLAASVDDSTDNKATAESTKSDGKSIFPLDLNQLEGTVAANFVTVISSDDDELAEQDAPDLELALGDKSPKKAVLQFFSPRVEEKQNQGDKLPADSPGSLSLSLAFPMLEKAQAGKWESQ